MTTGSGGDESEPEAIEVQLERQLEEQKESLVAVDEALASDPSNLELLAVHEELLLAIRDAEEGLLQLKHSHLPMDAGAILSSHISENSFENAEVEPLYSSQAKHESMKLNNLSVGSKCKFRHINGRWYNGCIIDFGSIDCVMISFLNPTSESMRICKFFLQQRCRFGSNCRFSHGLNVPLSLLKKYTPPTWHQSLVGSCIWAVSEIHSGLWRKAELNSWDEKLELGEVVFQDDGSAAKLGTDSLSMSEYADMREDDEDDNSSSEGYESTDNEHPEHGEYDNHQGLGFLEMSKSQMGVQTDVALFATWEHHTRGIASKMMASMGYCKGSGLGVSGQGIVDPIPVKVLPPKQSLDLAVASESRANNQGGGKRRTRGGRRMREKKMARAARAEEPESDMFSLINNHLASQDAITSISKPRKGLDEAAGSVKVDGRWSLVAYDDETRELRNRIEKLEDMVNRNRNKDKVVFEAAIRKLIETRKSLADVEAAHASASNVVTRKEKEKKWLKF